MDKKPEKKAYASPALIEYGAIVSQTHAGTISDTANP